MIPTVAVLDACVLYSAALRDLFMRLAAEKLFIGKWTEEIHEEWLRNVLENRPDLSPEKLARTRALMDLHAEGSLVEDYSDITLTLELPDEGDRHVLAAAIKAGAQVIVTFNLSDFPAEALGPHGVRAVHPDEFLTELFELRPGRFIAVIRILLSQLLRPQVTVEQYLNNLVKHGLPILARRLREYADQLEHLANTQPG